MCATLPGSFVLFFVVDFFLLFEIGFDYVSQVGLELPVFLYISGYLFLLFFFFLKETLCSFGCPGAQCVDQTRLAFQPVLKIAVLLP